MNTKEIAAEIISQLGGNKFIVMTGSKRFIHGVDKDGNPYLSMHLRRNKAKAKFLRITLNTMDTYDMRFTSHDKQFNLVTKAESNEVYADMLQGQFTKITGLDTKI